MWLTPHDRKPWVPSKLFTININQKEREHLHLAKDSLHHQAAAALLVSVLHLVAIALSLLRVSIAALALVMCLLVEATDLTHKVVERLVHIDPLLSRRLDQP